jgi:hypothetical protein
VDAESQLSGCRYRFPGRLSGIGGFPAARGVRHPMLWLYGLARAFSLLMETEARLYDFELTRFLHANRYPSSGQARGHASLENALASRPVACLFRTRGIGPFGNGGLAEALGLTIRARSVGARPFRECSCRRMPFGIERLLRDRAAVDRHPLKTVPCRSRKPSAGRGRRSPFLLSGGTLR